jgi:hypothetical protein
MGFPANDISKSVCHVNSKRMSHRTVMQECIALSCNAFQKIAVQGTDIVHENQNNAIHL